MKKHKLNPLPAKLISIGLAVLFVLFLALRYVNRVLSNSDYFRVKDIIVNEPGITGLSYLKGRNILSIDLRKESQYLLAAYPNYRKVSLARILPERLAVYFTKRKALGVVKLYRYFCVDSDAVLFDTPQQPIDPELPVIFGLEAKILGPKPAKSYNIRELRLALNIIEESEKSAVLKYYKPRRIDVTGSGNVSSYISGGLEVKFNDENVRGSLDILSNILVQMKNELGDIKYIDLRFKDPVVKFKEG